MFLARRHQHAVAKALAAVLLLAALAPAVARGLAHAQGRLAPWQLLCSAASTGLTSAADRLLAQRLRPGVPGQRNGDALAAHGLQHCALCQLGANSPALPAGLRPLLLPRWSPVALARRASGPPQHPLTPVWAGTQPRAPPVLG